MMTPIGLTSRWVAASRALESELVAPLFRDPYARALAGPEGFRLLAECEQLKPGWSADGGPDLYLSVRTRYFDDALLNLVDQTEIRQIVLLAAGMDTRAFRLPWPAGVSFFELDRLDVQDYKADVLAQLPAEPACRRTVIRVDLADDWVAALLQTGFRADLPAAFLVEGLFIYLDDSAMESLFMGLRRIAADGSWLGADLVNPAFLSAPLVKPLRQKMELLGCPWRCGVTDPEALFRRQGWQAGVVSPGELTANYNRWLYRVYPRARLSVPRSYFVTARRTLEGSVSDVGN